MYQKSFKTNAYNVIAADLILSQGAQIGARRWWVLPRSPRRCASAFLTRVGGSGRGRKATKSSTFILTTLREMSSSHWSDCPRGSSCSHGENLPHSPRYKHTLHLFVPRKKVTHRESDIYGLHTQTDVYISTAVVVIMYADLYVYV